MAARLHHISPAETAPPVRYSGEFMKLREQGWVFLFSALMILMALGAAGWLLIGGSGLQLETVFLLLVCGVVALVFVVALRFLGPS